jgi:predicted amidohydrolase YtcJ
MDADLAAVRPDFFEMELRELLSTKVELTVFNGRVVHNGLH